jgi:carbonic anhydrase
MPANAVSAKEALTLLKEGNARFVCGKTEGTNRCKARLLETHEQGQNPFVAIVSCSDSRVPLELIFDRGIGDIFVMRVAGNICGPSITGSLEYAVEHLGVKLLIILGHTKCGAVTAVVHGEHLDGHIATIAERIKPAVERARKPDANGNDHHLLNASIHQNVHYQIETLLKESPKLKQALAGGKISILGGIFDLEHGDIQWLGSHPNEKILLSN